MTAFFLRSPPFPWVAPRIAAVSIAGASAVADVSASITAIREAQIGGAFWLPPAATPPAGTIVVRARHVGDARDRIALATIAGAKTILVAGPDDAASWDIGCDRVVAGDVDPWSLLGPGIGLIADDDDEWRLVGAIASADLIGRAPTTDEIATVLGGAAYRDPFTDRPAPLPETVARLGQWRAILDANRSIAACAGMAWWKKERIGQFLWAGQTPALAFADTDDAAIAAAETARGALAVWPSRVTPDLIAEADRASVPIARIEDGFIRSVGLGADLIPPFSIVVDKGGIYYDPASGSDLEHLLETADISPELAARAERLAQTIVANGISKYGSAAPAPQAAPRTRRTVLVAGQVEDDASVRTGGGGVAGNRDLLARARAAEPDAILLFKPHPDVDAGHRVGRIPDAEALTLAAEIVRDEPIAGLLARVDAVHVLTSLVGFEALLRGLETHVHGSPFYAGWGLTRDHGPALPQRTRTRTLADLVACTLILYPRYLDPVTALPCPPETLLERFAGGWRPKRSLLVSARRLQGRIFKFLGKATS